MSLRKKLLDTFGAQVSSDHERYPADVKCLGFLYLYVGRYPRNNASRNNKRGIPTQFFHKDVEDRLAFGILEQRFESFGVRSPEKRLKSLYGMTRIVIEGADTPIQALPIQTNRRDEQRIQGFANPATHVPGLYGLNVSEQVALFGEAGLEQYRHCQDRQVIRISLGLLAKQIDAISIYIGNTIRWRPEDITFDVGRTKGSGELFLHVAKKTKILGMSATERIPGHPPMLLLCIGIPNEIGDIGKPTRGPNLFTRYPHERCRKCSKECQTLLVNGLPFTRRNALRIDIKMYEESHMYFLFR